MPKLEFAIAVKPFGAAAQRDAKKLTDELRAQNKEEEKQKKNLEELHKRQEKLYDLTKTRATALGESLREMSTKTAVAFEMGALRGVNRLQMGLEGAAKKVFNLKNAILATAVGAGAYMFGRKAIGNALGDIEAEQMVTRRFGATGGDKQIFAIAKRLSGRAGIEEGAAQSGLSEFAEAIEGTVGKGTAFRGKKLSGDGAKAVRSQLLEFAGKRYERLLTMFPQMDPQQVAELLGLVGTGPEGTRQFSRAFGINRSLARRIEEEAKKKNLGRGDVLDKLLEAGGITDKAADDKRKQFSFQIKAIGSQLEEGLGSVGRRAVEKLNAKFADGKTLADRFREALESDKGQKAIDSLGNALAKTVGFAADLAIKIPDALSWIDSHKTLLLTLGSVYGGLRVVGAGRDVIEGALGKNVFSKALGAVTGEGMPVKVTNWPGVGPGVPGGGSAPLWKRALGLITPTVAGAAAGAAVLLHSPDLNKGEGAFVRSDEFKRQRDEEDRKYKEEAFAKRDGQVFGPADAPGVAEFERQRFAAKLAAKNPDVVFGPGNAPGLAEFIRQAVGEHKGDTIVNVTLDGQKIAAAVEKRVETRIRNENPVKQ